MTSSELILLFIIIVSFLCFIVVLLMKNKKLRKENYKFNQYKEAIEESNIISTYDLNGNVTYVNDKFCKLTLYSKDEILGKTNALLKSETSKEVFKEIRKKIQNKKTWQGILQNKKKDGSFYYVDTIIKPILDKNNNILEYMAIKHEVTNLVQKSKELEKN